MGRNVLLVNPSEVNLADVKALAASHDASVVASPYLPPRSVFLVDESAASAWSSAV